MKNNTKYIEKLKKSKLILKQYLINLPFHEKIRRVRSMQQISVGFNGSNNSKNKKIYVWDLDAD